MAQEEEGTKHLVLLTISKRWVVEVILLSIIDCFVLLCSRGLCTLGLNVFLLRVQLNFNSKIRTTLFHRFSCFTGKWHTYRQEVSVKSGDGGIIGVIVRWNVLRRLGHGASFSVWTGLFTGCPCVFHLPVKATPTTIRRPPPQGSTLTPNSPPPSCRGYAHPTPLPPKAS